MEVDMGASLCQFIEATYISLLPVLPPLSPTSVVLTTYTGEKISPLGCVDVQVVHQSLELHCLASTCRRGTKSHWPKLARAY
uniref:Uncharacterized protein n=1 Tax=Amphimedon queenslandica TaxID=400682 RepID=A0A1X7T7I3_AMPQE